MSNILNSKDFGLKIYNRFPPKYREDDVSQNYALKRYLEALADGGFKHSIDEINGILDIKDPDKTKAEVLPILFKQYGLEIFNGIPEEYLRYLLPKLGEAWSMKGSLSVVEFITSSLSGVKTSTEVIYDEDDNPNIDVRFEMDYTIGDYFPDAEQFKKLLVSLLPFYCDTTLIYNYMFYEFGTIKLRDQDGITNISIKSIDEIQFNGIDNLSSDKTKYNVSVSAELINEDEESIIVRLSIVNEESKVKCKDLDIIRILDLANSDEVQLNRADGIYNDVVKQSIIDVHAEIINEDTENIVFRVLIQEGTKVKCEDSISDSVSNIFTDGTTFVSSFVKTSSGAVLGMNTLGNALFGSYLRADYHIDSVTKNEVETANFNNQVVDTFTNKDYNTLNNSFYTNSCSCFDKITVGDKTTIVFF